MKKFFILSILVIIIIICSVGLAYIQNQLHNLDENPQNEDFSKIISTYNNPIVPKGFKKIETSSASWDLENGIPKGWNNGLVIEDEIGNQFVWVPVNIEDEEYYKLAKDNDTKYYNKDNLIPNLKQDLQILKYGGFYISRYEAGISKEMQDNIKEFSSETNDIEGKPMSKQGQIVWNFISWSNAKKNSKNMYQNSNVVESDLITSKQLGSLYYWLNKSGYNIENSKNWGNFSNANFLFTGYYSIDYGKTYKYDENKFKSQYNMILSTGATERNKSNNIYDLVGNVMEYMDVLESKINNNKILNYYVIGGYYDNISDYSVMKAYGVTSKQGFRIILYNI